MSNESKFSDEEIEQLRRSAISRKKNIDYDKVQVARDLLLAARTDTPEEVPRRVSPIVESTSNRS